MGYHSSKASLTVAGDSNDVSKIYGNLDLQRIIECRISHSISHFCINAYWDYTARHEGRRYGPESKLIALIQLHKSGIEGIANIG